MNILEHELESFGQVVRTYQGNPTLGEVQHYLNATTPEGPATLNKRFRSWSKDEGLIVNDTHMICKYTTIARSFKTQSSFSLISVMMCNVFDNLDYISDTFTMFTDRVEYFALRDYPDDKPAGNMVDTFLKDLLSGSLDEEAVVERSQFVGIPSEGHFCLFYIEPDAESAPVNRLLSDTSMVVAPAKTIIMDNASWSCVSTA